MFDTTALRGPVDTAEVRSFRRQMVASGDPAWSPAVRPYRLLGWVAAAVALPLAGAAFLSQGLQLSAGWGAVIWAVIFLVVLADGVFLFRDELGLRGWPEQLRCARFAEANQLAYAPRTEAATHPGLIFRAGGDQETLHRMWSADSPITDCGTHRYVTGWRRTRQVHEWQYAAIHLPGPLPSMLLDAHANNLYGDLSQRFPPELRQSLGGEMDQHFDLYCPERNRDDAFYIFTPDLLALLVDHARFFDVEFVGNWMFLYTRYGLSVSDPDTWDRLAAIERTITPLVRNRTRAYRDRE